MRSRRRSHAVLAPGGAGGGEGLGDPAARGSASLRWRLWSWGQGRRVALRATGEARSHTSRGRHLRPASAPPRPCSPGGAASRETIYWPDFLRKGETDAFSSVPRPSAALAAWTEPLGPGAVCSPGAASSRLADTGGMTAVRAPARPPPHRERFSLGSGPSSLGSSVSFLASVTCRPLAGALRGRHQGHWRPPRVGTGLYARPASRVRWAGGA